MKLGSFASLKLKKGPASFTMEKKRRQGSLYFQPKQCIMIREIPESYHRFVLFDSPKRVWKNIEERVFSATFCVDVNLRGIISTGFKMEIVHLGKTRKYPDSSCLCLQQFH